MNLNKSTNLTTADQQWDIDRYLLGDPTLDRSAFEQRMLNDLSLAEQVAASVEHLQWLESAAKSSAPICSSASSAASPTQHAVQTSPATVLTPMRAVWGMLATVAVLLLIAIGPWREPPTTTNVDRLSADHAASDRQLSQIAEHWFAIGSLQNTAAEDDELLDGEHGLRKHEPAESTDAHAAEGESVDWLVEAARQFYQDHEGTQG